MDIDVQIIGEDGNKERVKTGDILNGKKVSCQNNITSCL